MSILDRKRAKKRRMKYAEAVKALKAYQNSEVQLVRMIDNYLTPNKSISQNCQVPHCGQRIRYEYVLQNKITKDILIAGSTCVWEILKLSDADIKRFEDIERAIKDFHMMIDWRRNNRDVYAKIIELKRRGVMTHKVFWEEIEYLPLDEEDTLYIRNLDIDQEEARYNRLMEIKRQKEEAAKNRGQQAKVTIPDCEYELVIKALDTLMTKEPDNTFYQSLKKWSDTQKLTERQIHCIKADTNRNYYKEVVANNPEMLRRYGACDTYIEAKFKEIVGNGMLQEAREEAKKGGVRIAITKYAERFHDILKGDAYWDMYRLKNMIFVR